MGAQCLDENTVSLWLEGGLSETQQADFHGHVAVCEACRVLVGDALQSSRPMPESADVARSVDDSNAAFGGVQVGEVVAGKYKVERILGSGGMGFVVEALHLGLDRQVALKFMRREFAKQPDAKRRFKREAKAVSALNNQHVVRTFDVAEDVDGTPFLVMERLHGEDLASLIRRRGRVSFEEALLFVRQIGAAMVEAHRCGVIHRDLKPANVFVTVDENQAVVLKVLDFGLSKRLWSTEGSTFGVTRSHQLMGSPLYMAPEQLLAADSVDARADVWALACIFHELLYGTPPFTAESLPLLVTAILHRPYLPPPRIGDSPPEWVEPVIKRALEKRREQRTPTVTQLLDELARGPNQRWMPDWISSSRTRQVLLAVGVALLSTAIVLVVWAARPGASELDRGRGVVEAEVAKQGRSSPGKAGEAPAGTVVVTNADNSAGTPPTSTATALEGTRPATNDAPASDIKPVDSIRKVEQGFAPAPSGRIERTRLNGGARQSSHARRSAPGIVPATSDDALLDVRE